MVAHLLRTNRPYWDNGTDYIRKNSPKRVALLNGRLPAFRQRLALQNRDLNGKYECFLAFDVALFEGKFAYVHNLLKAEIAQSIKGLDQGGFQSLWERLIMHGYKVQAMEWSKPREASSYVSINTLSPFFKVVGISLVLLGVICILEIVSSRQEMWGCCAWRGKNSVHVFL
ncbi:hypothetical protein Fcan01_23688, partial [Folsomia candida]